MIGDKKEINAGNDSTNIQGDEVTVHQNTGLSYSEVRQVAMDVFKSNFYDLGGKVEQLINERAESFLNQYLDKLEREAPEALEYTQDPDVRYVIYEAQKSFVRLGDEDTSKILVDLLVKRTKLKDQKLQKLVCNEALDIIPKLTNRHLDILTVIFIINYVNIKIFSPKDYIQVVNLFSKGLPQDEVIYQHLQYTGCISISIGSVDIENIFKNHYGGLIREHNKEQTIRSALIEVDHGYLELMELWSKTKLCNSSLTSVGIAIALSNFKMKTGSNWDLSIWIKE